MASSSNIKSNRSHDYRESMISAPNIKQLLLDASSTTISKVRFQTIAELLKQNEADSTPSMRLSSTIPSLDAVLLGGFRRGSIIELCGMPGTGKTCFAYMLICAALKMNIPENEVAVAFVDFALKFSTERLLEIMQTRFKTLSRMQCEQKLKMTQYLRIRPDSEIAVNNVVDNLKALLDNNPLRLVIVDALDFGLWMRGTEQRIRVMLHRLSRLAMKHEFILLVNTHSRTWSRSFWAPPVQADAASGAATENKTDGDDADESRAASARTHLETVHSTLPDDLSSLFSHRFLLVKGRQYNTLRVNKCPTGQSAALLYNIDAGGFTVFGDNE